MKLRWKVVIVILGLLAFVIAGQVVRDLMSGSNQLAGVWTVRTDGGSARYWFKQDRTYTLSLATANNPDLMVEAYVGTWNLDGNSLGLHSTSTSTNTHGDMVCSITFVDSNTCWMKYSNGATLVLRRD